ncbi:hypothetical protein M0813_08814 [Anaeramoeba flamelloides]|uniref:GRAM domain-containing protein n=1 Tax=Anaeramoeba flamelloides TaxID=1746091 RepID=A0ABQ8X738_9EUKA|nr:hypothetical protein M0813_08814 [Anaeramoeba flamelloides]
MGSYEKIKQKCELALTETIYSHYHCALREKGGVLRQGVIYITNKRALFHSNIFGIQKTVHIKYSEMTMLKKRTFFLLPNSIRIQSKDNSEGWFFTSFLSRDDCIREILLFRRILKSDLGDEVSRAEKKKVNKINQKNASKEETEEDTEGETEEEESDENDGDSSFVLRKSISGQDLGKLNEQLMEIDRILKSSNQEKDLAEEDEILKRHRNTFVGTRPKIIKLQNTFSNLIDPKLERRNSLNDRPNHYNKESTNVSKGQPKEGKATLQRNTSSNNGSIVNNKQNQKISTSSPLTPTPVIINTGYLKIYRNSPKKWINKFFELQISDLNVILACYNNEYKAKKLFQFYLSPDLIKDLPPLRKHSHRGVSGVLFKIITFKQTIKLLSDSKKNAVNWKNSIKQSIDDVIRKRKQLEAKQKILLEKKMKLQKEKLKRQEQLKLQQLERERQLLINKEKEKNSKNAGNDNNSNNKKKTSQELRKDLILKSRIIFALLIITICIIIVNHYINNSQMINLEHKLYQVKQREKIIKRKLYLIKKFQNNPTIITSSNLLLQKNSLKQKAVFNKNKEWPHLFQNVNNSFNNISLLLQTKQQSLDKSKLLLEEIIQKMNNRTASITN